MKYSREVKIGIVLCVAIFTLYWGINFLKGKRIFSSQIDFYTVLEETRGLSVSNHVTLNGIKIGQVSRISFHPDNTGKVLVKSFIDDKSLDIPVNSVAQIRKPSLVGEMEVAIILGDSPIALKNGDTLASIYIPSLTDDLNEQLLPLKEQVEGLVAQVNSVFVGIERMLDHQNLENIAQTLDNLAKITVSLSKQANRVDGIMTSVETMVRQLDESSRGIAASANNFSAISQELAAANLGQTLELAGKSLESFNQLLEKIKTSEGSLNMLLDDKELYNNLQQSTKQLELLLEDIRKNPKRYINFSVF